MPSKAALARAQQRRDKLVASGVVVPIRNDLGHTHHYEPQPRTLTIEEIAKLCGLQYLEGRVS